MFLPKVTIQIVTCNSMKYLPECLKAIFSQSYKNFQVLIIDNNSQDDVTTFVQRNYPEVTVFRNKKNLGFAKANNQGIRLLHSPYLVLCNPDIVLENNWLENIMQKVESGNYEGVGSFGGKLLKLKLIEGEIVPESKTNLIDSCGLLMARNRRVVEIGAGKEDGGFTKEEQVFGHSGALLLYKRRALEDCLIKTKKNPTGEYFDEDFFFYKEDVDLAWRMQLLGWQSVYFPEAVAYHVRTFSGSENQKTLDLIRNRKKQSVRSNYFSYRNHPLLLIKNEMAQNFWPDFFPIFWFEFKKAGYLLLFETKNIKAWWEILRLTPKMRAKRKEIFKKAKVDAGYIAHFIK